MKRFVLYVYGLFGCLYLFTVGYLDRRNRQHVSTICRILHFQKVREFFKPEIKTILPQVKISQLADDHQDIQLRQIEQADGNVFLIELFALVTLVKKFKPGNVFEIGTFNGRTTLNLACNAPASARIYTLDLPDEKSLAEKSSDSENDMSFVQKTVTGHLFHGTSQAQKIIQLYGDSSEFDFKPYYNSIDFIFIDGAHTYKHTLSDSEHALKMLRNGHGVIVWHDYAGVWEGVVRAINQLYKTREDFINMRCIEGTSLVYLVK